VSIDLSVLTTVDVTFAIRPVEEGVVRIKGHGVELVPSERGFQVAFIGKCEVAGGVS
jgi:hypothetical protein